MTAEFRGPGIRNQFEEGPSDYELEIDRTRGFSVRSGRIILLGDGTEVITEQNDDDLFDHTEEDKALANHVQQNQPEATRNEREGTPAPQATASASSQAGQTPQPEAKVPSPAKANGSSESTAGASEKSTPS